MKHIIIATTAINRPMLHLDNMVSWADWVAELKDKDTSLKWFINIDMIEKIQSSYLETQKTFEKIINERIPTVFLSNPNGKGNFLEACKRLSINIVQYVNNLRLSEEEQRNIKIIWLEDDWKLNPDTKILSKDVIKNYTTTNSHTNLSFNRNNYIWGLAPSIISYSLWKNLFYAAWMSETNAIDPEHCVGIYFRKMFGNPDHLCNVTIINKPIKDKYLNERHMSFQESYYTYHDDKYQVKNNHRYIFKNCLFDYLGNKMVFIRITASFCIDGCNYGRNFLQQYNISKSHSVDVNQFYQVEQKKEELPLSQKRKDKSLEINNMLVNLELPKTLEVEVLAPEPLAKDKSEYVQLKIVEENTVLDISKEEKKKKVNFVLDNDTEEPQTLIL
jgi:hypothetical protein